MTARFDIGDTPADLRIVLEPETKAERILLQQFYDNPEEKQLSMLAMMDGTAEDQRYPEHIELHFVGKYARR